MSWTVHTIARTHVHLTSTHTHTHTLAHTHTHPLTHALRFFIFAHSDLFSSEPRRLTSTRGTGGAALAIHLHWQLQALSVARPDMGVPCMVIWTCLVCLEDAPALPYERGRCTLAPSPFTCHVSRGSSTPVGSVVHASVPHDLAAPSTDWHTHERFASHWPLASVVARRREKERELRGCQFCEIPLELL